MVHAHSAVLRDPDGRFAFESIELDGPRADEVLVRIVATGMCHTDMLARNPGFQVCPVVLGHEGAGVVEAVGASVEHLVPGDHVVLAFDSCGGCAQCRSGAPAYCDTFEARNLTGRRSDGSPGAVDAGGSPVTSRWFAQSSFGEYAIATARNAVKVDRDLPLRRLGPLGCGIMTGAGAVLKEMKPPPGSSIAVFGAGAVGLAAVMAAKLVGAADIVAVDIHASRRELALELGATRVVDGASPDVHAEVVAGTAGLDFVFDTTGIGEVMATAVRSLRRPGLGVLVAAGKDPLSIPPAALIGRRLTFVYEGSAIPQLFIPQLIDFHRRGLFPFDRLITEYAFDDIDQAEADSKSGVAVKPVLIIDPTFPTGSEHAT